MAGPSLTSYAVTVLRQQEGTDAEGMPVRNWAPIDEFRAGFGAVSPSSTTAVGAAGQRVEAAISTRNRIDVRVGDQIQVAGRTWQVVSVTATGYTNRVLLAQWGTK